MVKRSALLIEKDPKIEGQLRELLNDHELLVFPQIDEKIEPLRNKKIELALIDIDKSGIEGLAGMRQVQRLMPKTPIVILAASNDIPLAVKAAKLGAADFIQKPFTSSQLASALKKITAESESAKFSPSPEIWMQGMSPGIKKMYAEIKEGLKERRNLVLLGERGIDKLATGEYIHNHSFKKGRKLRRLDLNSFRRENQESFFWATLQEVMGEPGIAEARADEDLCGTLFLDNIDDLESNFKASILDFMRERKGKIDKEILVIIGTADRKGVPFELSKDYSWIEIPPLRERKEDLSQLMTHYINLECQKHDRVIRSIGLDLLSFIYDYDFPGNYQELECLVEQAVLLSTSEEMGLRDFPLAFKGVLKTEITKAWEKEELSLPEARKKFEKELYQILASKCGGKLESMAKFLDIPKTSLSERMSELFVEK